jgi:hypothetical protein
MFHGSRRFVVHMRPLLFSHVVQVAHWTLAARFCLDLIAAVMFPFMSPPVLIAAVHVEHRLHHHHPSGSLFLNLRKHYGTSGNYEERSTRHTILGQITARLFRALFRKTAIGGDRSKVPRGCRTLKQPGSNLSLEW